jgi:ATPase subunit of ABC transporter with duplicated ATPase domains
MFSVTNLAKSYGARTLFSGVSIRFNTGCRYGLVGANGSGKSTLLRILAGDEHPSAGTVSVPRRLRVGVLRQDHFRYENELIMNVALMGNRELWDAMAEKAALLARADRAFDAERYAELEDVILRHNGYAQEARAGEILEGLGIPTAQHHEPMSTLSGGFKLRVLLAQALAATPDVLLLDEPNNHLDILSIRWLEKFLAGFAGCVIVVSHDHRFLDNACTHIVDIDYETATLYTGNYSSFAEAKVAERARKEAEIAKQEKKIAENRAFVERFRAKATKARQAQSKLKLIERMDIEPLPPSSRRYPTFRFEQRRPSGRCPLRLTGISKSFGDRRVLTGVSLEVERGDRLAIIGPNGIGKSTLLKVVMGGLAADSGAVEWGYETYPGYFAQDHGSLFEDSKATVESWLGEVAAGESIGFVRGKLGLVLFSGDEVTKRVSALSGGEIARLVFCRLHVEQPNVLVLDEPTNHLDLEAIEALVTGLEAYPGTLVFVSHDRWFVSRLANRILELTPQGPRDFRGSYREYVERCGDDHLDASTVLLRAKRERREQRRGHGGEPGPPAEHGPAAHCGAAVQPGHSTRQVRPARPDGRAQRRAAAHRKSLEGRQEELTERIEAAEARIRTIEALFCAPGFFAETPADEVRRLEEERRQLRRGVADLTADWEAVEEEMQATATES